MPWVSRGRQLLDLAFVRADLGVARAHDDRLELFPVLGPTNDAITDRQQIVDGRLAHAVLPVESGRFFRF